MSQTEHNSFSINYKALIHLICTNKELFLNITFFYAYRFANNANHDKFRDDVIVSIVMMSTPRSRPPPA